MTSTEIQIQAIRSEKTATTTDMALIWRLNKGTCDNCKQIFLLQLKQWKWIPLHALLATKKKKIGAVLSFVAKRYVIPKLKGSAPDY